MTEDNIGYSSSFQLSDGRWEKIWKEVSLKDGENDMEKLSELKQTVESFHRKSNPNLYPNGNEPIISNFIPDVQVTKDSKELATQRIIDQINQCSDAAVLKSFELLAKSNSEIHNAYDNKLKTF